MGVYTSIILAVYLVAMRTVFRYEQQQIAAFIEEEAERHPGVTLRQAILRYTVATLVVVGMGTWLPFIGETMATVMGWHKTFVGTLFIAFATSVPEVSVTVAASRIGALDMVIGNLLGSNLFDMMIVAVDDIFFLNGPILSHVSPLHAVSAMMMTGLTVVGLLYRPKTRVFWRVGWTSLALLTLYMLNALVLFLYER